MPRLEFPPPSMENFEKKRNDIVLPPTKILEKEEKGRRTTEKGEMGHSLNTKEAISKLLDGQVRRRGRETEPERRRRDPWLVYYVTKMFVCSMLFLVNIQFYISIYVRYAETENIRTHWCALRACGERGEREEVVYTQTHN